ncbi:hypothetical protein ETH_00004475 [Eimeria tenella]|uniref:Uncharacterized protein n=1 Tax=Eimeria tenella TaxID=5802 RepID=U6L5Z3_EIMTE|nr:hypothetical protein ETH_00004475 [Eimeria tenella]CDJ43984.1 hypothetical protein ETH_00004475 [Eimeria tenella]|eukprot:XP_013234733.1 hypothetical protein ETH_00004475 [Eimeria tenella]
MFCDTSPGAVAMVRQLQPHLHIETDAWVSEQLKGKIADVRTAKEGLQHYLTAMETSSAAEA